VWKVTLLRQNEANAYCLPGGKIVVFTGILPLTKNDAGLATVQAVRFWKRMAHASAGKEPPEFAGDHPSDQHRVERIKGWLPEAKRAFSRLARASGTVGLFARPRTPGASFRREWRAGLRVRGRRARCL
jgi:hypothetical protein